MWPIHEGPTPRPVNTPIRVFQIQIQGSPRFFTLTVDFVFLITFFPCFSFAKYFCHGNGKNHLHKWHTDLLKNSQQLVARASWRLKNEWLCLWNHVLLQSQRKTQSCLDGSPGKGTCHQTQRPEFNPWNSHSGKRNNLLMLSSDLHTSDGMCASTDRHTINMHLHAINKQFHHKKKMQTLQLSIRRCILQARHKVPAWTELRGTRTVNQWVCVLCHPIQTILNDQLTEKGKHLTAPHGGTGLQSALMWVPHMHPPKMRRSNILTLSRNSLKKQWQGKPPAHSFGGALEHWVCMEDVGLPGERGHGVNTSTSYVNHNKTVPSAGEESHSESVIPNGASASYPHVMTPSWNISKHQMHTGFQIVTRG